MLRRAFSIACATLLCGFVQADETLEDARRSFDVVALKEAHQDILDSVAQSPYDFGLQVEAAEGYLMRANRLRHRRHILDLPKKEDEAAESEQVALAEQGLPHAERALALAHSDLERVRASRIASELYAYLITGMISGMKNGPKSQKYLDEALRLAPNSPECRRALGEMYLYNPPISGGDVDKAVEIFDTLTKEQAASDVYPVLLAMAYRKKGDLDAAQEAAREALARNPHNEDAKHLLETPHTAEPN